jgi:uncharacterized protein YjbI with pentapeptide repeats
MMANNNNNNNNSNSSFENSKEVVDFTAQDLRNVNLKELNLVGAILTKTHLEGAHLEGVDLTYAHLEKAHLQGAHLQGANLKKANLEEANLEYAHLEGAHLEVAFLNRVHLEDAHLEGAHLEEAYLQLAHLEGAHLEEAHLEEAYLRYAILYGAHLEGAHLERANLQKAHLHGAHLEGAHLEGAHLEKVRLNHAHLEGAHLEDAHLERADLGRAHLERAQLNRAHLEGADLRYAILQGAHLEGAHLERAHLYNAYLEGAHLEGADLRGVDLTYAHLEGAHLEGAHLQGANLSYAILVDAHLEGAHLEGANLRSVDLQRADLTRVDLAGISLSNYQRVQIAESDAQRQQIAASDARRQQIAANRLRRISISQQRNRNLFSFQQMPSHASRKIFIRRQLHTPRNLGSGPRNNSSSNSCPNFKHLYDFIMEQDLTDGFRFEFEDIDVIDITGLTRQVFDKILPVYVHLFFIKTPGEEFLLLKEKVNMEQLNQHTIQLIKLAKAAHAQIILRINPEVIEFLSLANPPESIANNKNFNKLYAIFKAQINSSGNNVSNYLLNKSLKPKINAAKGNLDALNRALKQEILFRKKLNGFGFTSLEQYYNMARFIKTFWNKSNDNKVTIEKVTLDLFANNIKFDVESFRGRIKIIRSNGTVLDLSSIPPDLYQVYPGLKPLLEYILSESEDGNENRKFFTKFVSGTEYFLGQLKISLTNQTMSPEIYNNSPFFGHTCDNRVDMFKAPANYRGKITQNVINAQLRATTSSFQGSE